jgi:hypothetical protein
VDTGWQPPTGYLNWLRILKFDEIVDDLMIQSYSLYCSTPPEEKNLKSEKVPGVGQKGKLDVSCGGLVTLVNAVRLKK